MRSASKPLQALPLVRSRDDLADDETRHRLRLASRHSGAGRRGARATRAGRGERGSPRARATGGGRRSWSTTTARATTPGCSPSAAPAAGRRRVTACPSIPSSRRASRCTPRPAELEPGEIPTGTDGCGIVTFALTLQRMARAFSRLESLQGGARIAAACALARISSAARTARTSSSCARRRAGSQRSEPKASSVAPPRRNRGRAQGRGRRESCPRAGARGLPRAARVELPDLAARPVLNTRGERVGAIVTAGSGSF